MRTLFALFVVGILISGCGLHQFKAGDPLLALEQTKEASKAACYAAQAQNRIDTSGLSELGKVMLLQQQSYERMVAAFTGKSFDPCGSGTNLNDVLIADVQQRNETLRSLGGKALGAAQFAVGAWAAAEIVDSIGRNSGARTYGDNSAISTTRTSSESSARAINAGDGSATTSPGYSEPTAVPPVGTVPVITAD